VADATGATTGATQLDRDQLTVGGLDRIGQPGHPTTVTLEMAEHRPVSKPPLQDHPLSATSDLPVGQARCLTAAVHDQLPRNGAGATAPGP
jgi:hypothetical protein